MKKVILSFLSLSLIYQTHALGWKWWFAGTTATTVATWATHKHFAEKKDLERQSFNVQNLVRLQKKLAQTRDAKLVIVTDLHDVLFKRKSGDIQRAWQLSWSELGQFVGRLVKNFAPRYLWQKMVSPRMVRPSIEGTTLVPIEDPQERAKILALISPFEVNPVMYHFYLKCKYPIFACSNIGPISYEHMCERVRQKGFDLAHFIRGTQLATPENGYTQKNRPATFNHLETCIEDTLDYKPTHILLIDDRKKNIELCQQTLSEKNIEVYGYIFKKKEGAEELIENLCKYKIEL